MVRASILLVASSGFLVACGGDAFSDALSGGDGGVEDAQAPDVDTRADAATHDGHDAFMKDAGLLPDALVDTSAPPDGASCAGACVPPAPGGWAGPLELAVGSSPPTCGTAYAGSTQTLHDGLQADNATCGCDCGAPSGVTCSVAVSGFCAGGGLCQGTKTAYVTAPSGTCEAIQSWCSPLDISGATASGGACAAQPSVIVPAPSWKHSAIACAPSKALEAGACAQSGDLCAPSPDPQFSVCVEATGDVACPLGPYSLRFVEYGDVDDTRGCSACSCGAPSGTTCAGMVSEYSDGACATRTKGPYPLSNCIPLGGSFFEYTAQPAGGACTPSSVAPVGAAAPAQAVTFCCLGP